MKLWPALVLGLLAPSTASAWAEPWTWETYAEGSNGGGYCSPDGTGDGICGGLNQSVSTLVAHLIAL